MVQILIEELGEPIEGYRRVKEDEPCRADDQEWNNYE